MPKKRKHSANLRKKSSPKPRVKPAAKPHHAKNAKRKPNPSHKPARQPTRKPKPPSTRKRKPTPKPRTKPQTKRQPNRSKKRPAKQTKGSTQSKLQRKPRASPKPRRKKRKPRASLSLRSQRRLNIGVRVTMRKVGSNQGSLRVKRADEGKTNASFEVAVRSAYWLDKPTPLDDAHERISDWLERTLLIGAAKIAKRMGRTNDVLLVGWKWHLENAKTNEARSTPHFEEQFYHELSFNKAEIFADARKQIDLYKEKQLKVRGIEAYIRTFRLPGNPPSL